MTEPYSSKAEHKKLRRIEDDLRAGFPDLVAAAEADSAPVISLSCPRRPRTAAAMREHAFAPHVIGFVRLGVDYNLRLLLSVVDEVGNVVEDDPAWLHRAMPGLVRVASGPIIPERARFLCPSCNYDGRRKVTGLLSDYFKSAVAGSPTIHLP